MRRIIKILPIGVLAILGLFFFNAQLVEASILYSQNSSSSLSAGYFTNYSNGAQSLGDGLEGDFESIAVWATDGGQGFTKRITICANASSTRAQNNDCAQSGIGYSWYAEAGIGDGYTLVASSTFACYNPATGGPITCPEDFATFNPALFYRVQMYSNYTGLQVYGSSSSSSYPNGVFNSGNDANVKDAYFVINGTPPAPPAPTLSFVVPQATSTPDFPRWLVLLDNLATSTSYTVKIDYELTPISTGGHEDTLVFNSGDLTSQYIYITKSFGLAYPFSGSDWVATGTLSSAGIYLATSTVEFSVLAESFDYSSSTYTVTPTGTSSLVATCDPDSGFISNSLCSVGVWLFYPSQSSLDNFSLLKTQYENKPPFGYFLSISSVLSDFSNGTSSIVLISTTTYEAFSGVFDGVRAGLVWVLWLMFGFWLFHKFRGIEL